MPQVRSIAVADPSPARALLNAAAAADAALIVVGSSHAGYHGRLHPGSTAWRLLQGAPCPVALAPQGHRLRPHLRSGRTAAAFDGSPGARAALDAAALIARATDTPLRVIRVFARDLPTPPSQRLPPGFVRITADAEQAAREELECAVAELAGADAEAAFLIGDPADELARESEVCDLMVIGSRGYGPAPAVLLGDVSGRADAHSGLPGRDRAQWPEGPADRALRPQVCCDAVSLNQLPGLTLGELSPLSGGVRSLERAFRTPLLAIRAREGR